MIFLVVSMVVIAVYSICAYEYDREMRKGCVRTSMRAGSPVYRCADETGVCYVYRETLSCETLNTADIRYSSVGLIQLKRVWRLYEGAEGYVNSTMLAA